MNAQPNLSKKELPPQANGTENVVNESPNEESQELSPSEVIEPVYDQPRPIKRTLFTPESPLNPSPPPIPPQTETTHYINIHYSSSQNDIDIC